LRPRQTERAAAPFENALEESLLKRVSIFTIMVLIAVGATSQALSLARQQKQQPKQHQKRPARGAKPTPTPTPDMRAEASEVATQIKNVSNFIYIYGKVVNGLEVADEQAKSNQASPETQAKIKESKDKLIAKIKDVRIGLEGLANGFQANPRLQVQFLKVSYATEAALNAERLAAAGRYNDAGKFLVTVVERLTDTIISMRLP
jgi:hypothetical protein